MNLRRILITLTVIALLSAAGCNLPGGNSESANQTAVAQTLTGLFTPAATTPPPPPSRTPETAPTRTPPPAEAPTQPPAPSATSAPVQPGACDAVTFVNDVSVPDGTVFAPGTTFNKTWKLMNSGTCAWTPGYKLVFDSGALMDGPTAIPLSGNVNPGQTVDLTVTLKAPAAPGIYRGNWKLENAAGARFGLGGSTAFWVEIKVEGAAAVTNTPVPAITLIKPLITLQITLKPPLVVTLKPPQIVTLKPPLVTLVSP